MMLNSPLHSVHSEYPCNVENEGQQQQPVGSESVETKKRRKSSVWERISIASSSTATGRDEFGDEQITSASLSRKRLSALTVSKRWQRVSHQLYKRKILFEKRKRTSDFALAFGMFGIILMIIENELASNGVYTQVF
jgi:hypothetical protein